MESADAHLHAELAQFACDVHRTRILIRLDTHQPDHPAAADPLRDAFGPHACIRLIESHDVDLIVVGKAIQMSGEASESMGHCKAFVRSLSKLFPAIPVEWEDERFTSKMASHAIAHSGLKKKDRQEKGLIDKVSAVIILQSFMERLPQNPKA